MKLVFIQPACGWGKFFRKDFGLMDSLSLIALILVLILLLSDKASKKD